MSWKHKERFVRSESYTKVRSDTSTPYSIAAARELLPRSRNEVAGGKESADARVYTDYETVTDDKDMTSSPSTRRPRSPKEVHYTDQDVTSKPYRVTKKSSSHSADYYLPLPPSYDATSADAAAGITWDKHHTTAEGSSSSWMNEDPGAMLADRDGARQLINVLSPNRHSPNRTGGYHGNRSRRDDNRELRDAKKWMTTRWVEDDGSGFIDGLTAGQLITLLEWLRKGKSVEGIISECDGDDNIELDEMLRPKHLHHHHHHLHHQQQQQQQSLPYRDDEIKATNDDAIKTSKLSPVSSPRQVKVKGKNKTKTSLSSPVHSPRSVSSSTCRQQQYRSPSRQITTTSSTTTHTTLKKRSGSADSSRKGQGQGRVQAAVAVSPRQPTAAAAAPAAEYDAMLPTTRPHGNDNKDREIEYGASLPHHSSSKNATEYDVMLPSPRYRGNSSKQEEQESTGHSSFIFKPTKRLIGEVAYQLDRRILEYIFNDSDTSGSGNIAAEQKNDGQSQGSRRRFYGYIIQNIPEKINRECVNPNTGMLDSTKQYRLQNRFNFIFKRLKSLGYDYLYHPEITCSMVNRYGLLPELAGKGRVDEVMTTLNSVSHVSDMLTSVTSGDDLQHALLLLNCLAAVAREDGRLLINF